MFSELLDCFVLVSPELAFSPLKQPKPPRLRRLTPNRKVMQSSRQPGTRRRGPPGVRRRERSFAPRRRSDRNRQFLNSRMGIAWFFLETLLLNANRKKDTSR